MMRRVDDILLFALVSSTRLYLLTCCLVDL